MRISSTLKKNFFCKKLFFKEIKEGKNHFLKETSSFNRSLRGIASEKMINDASTKGTEKSTRLGFFFFFAHSAAPRKSIIDQRQCHRFPHSPLLLQFIIIFSSFIFSGHVQVAIIIVESEENAWGKLVFEHMQSNDTRNERVK